MKKLVLSLFFIVFSVSVSPVFAKDKYITLADDPDQEKIPVRIIQLLSDKNKMRYNPEPQFFTDSYLKYTIRHGVDVNNDGEVDLFKIITISTSPEAWCDGDCGDFFIYVEWYNFARYFKDQIPFVSDWIASQYYQLSKAKGVSKNKNLRSHVSSIIKDKYYSNQVTHEELKQFLQQQRIKDLK